MDFIMNNNCQPKKPYTFAIHTSQRYDQKSQKSMSCQRTIKMKIVANLKDNYKEMKKCQCLTKAIRNLGKVQILKLIVLNKFSGKLKNNSFIIPNYA